MGRWHYFSSRTAVAAQTFGSQIRDHRTEEQYLDAGQIQRSIVRLQEVSSLSNFRKKKDSVHATCLRSLIDLARAMIGGQAAGRKVVFSQRERELLVCFDPTPQHRVNDMPDFRWEGDFSKCTTFGWFGVAFAIDVR